MHHATDGAVVPAAWRQAVAGPGCAVRAAPGVVSGAGAATALAGRVRTRSLRPPPRTSSTLSAARKPTTVSPTRPPLVEPVVSSMMPKAVGATNPPRLPIELISAMPGAAARASR